MNFEYNLDKFKIDKNLRERTPKQVCGEPMMEWFPKEQHSFMWRTIAKYPIPDLKYAFNVCKEKNIKNVAYMAKILHNRFKDMST